MTPGTVKPFTQPMIKFFILIIHMGFRVLFQLVPECLRRVEIEL